VEENKSYRHSKQWGRKGKREKMFMQIGKIGTTNFSRNILNE
jgi:hypothetical protein